MRTEEKITHQNHSNTFIHEMLSFCFLLKGKILFCHCWSGFTWKFISLFKRNFNPFYYDLNFLYGFIIFTIEPMYNIEVSTNFILSQSKFLLYDICSTNFGKIRPQKISLGFKMLFIANTK